LKKKKNFLIGNQLWAEFDVAQSASLHVCGLRGPASRRRGLADSWTRIAERIQTQPDKRLTRPELVIKPIKTIVHNHIYPLPDFF
jgi:hypothetical protein